MGF
ncbi:putative membrane protein, partial [Yersinia pestis PY-59]|jgi:hypothetical protein